MGNLETARSVAICKSCGFAAPGLDMCKLTGTCVLCARNSLGDKCAACPDLVKCNAAVEGLKFLKRLEPHLDVYVDLAKNAVRQLEPYDRVELGVAFLKSLMGLIKLLEREPPARAFPAWVATVFRQEIISKLARTPVVVKIDLHRPLYFLCASFRCRGLEGPINNLLNALVSLSLIEGIKDPTRYFRLGV